MRATKTLAVAMLTVVAVTARPLVPQPATRAAVIETVPPEMSSRYVGLRGRLQPSAQAWVETQARMESRLAVPDVAALERATQSRFASMGLGGDGGDIEAMVFIVLMGAVNDEDQDLEQQMAATKALTDAKAAARALMEKAEMLQAGLAAAGTPPNAACRSLSCDSLSRQFVVVSTAANRAGHALHTNLSGPITRLRLQQIQAQLGADLNSMNEQSEMESLQLQMIMDRRSKLISTLSNVLKKISSTGDAVVANMK